MKVPNNPHRNVQKKIANSTTKRRDRQHASGQARFDVAADHELDNVQANKNTENALPAVELRHCQQRRKQRCNKWTDKGNVVESKCDHAPFDRELQAGDPSEDADEQAGHGAHLRSDKQLRQFRCLE